MPMYHHGTRQTARWWSWVTGLVLVAASGCTTTEHPPTVAPPRDGQTADWGPLAVVDDPATAGGGAGFGPGTLQIGAECVTLHVGEHASTLVWRSADVTWDSSTREIVVAGGRDGPVRLADGATILVGGSGDAYRSPAWLAPPAAACPATRFNVHSVDQPAVATP